MGNLADNLTVIEAKETNGYIEGKVSYNLTVTKLSKLQRFILKAAVCNLWNEKSFQVSDADIQRARAYGFNVSGNKEIIHLFTYEVMTGFFGFYAFTNAL